MAMLGRKEGEESELVIVTRLENQCGLVEAERKCTRASAKCRCRLRIQYPFN